MTASQERLTTLATRAQTGDRKALDCLVAEMRPNALAYCRRMGVRRQDRDDAIQDIWINVVQNLDKLRSHAAFLAWFRRIAFGTLKNRATYERSGLRHAVKCDSRLLVAQQSLAREPGPLLSAAHAENRQIILDAVGSIAMTCHKLDATACRQVILAWLGIHPDPEINRCRTSKQICALMQIPRSQSFTDIIDRGLPELQARLEWRISA